MVFKAKPTGSSWHGVFLCLLIIGINIVLIIAIQNRPVDWIKFSLITLILISLPLLVHLAYRTWSLFTLEYWVDRNAVTIYWAGIRQSIPIYRIQRVIQGQVKDVSLPRWYHWPSLHIRDGQTLSLRHLRLYATCPLHECILLELDESVVAVSPVDADRFIDVLQERYQIGPAIDVSDSQRPAVPIQRLWKVLADLDRVSIILLLGGIAGVLILFGTLMIRFPALPGDLVMRYNVDGDPELIRTKNALFILPVIGLMAWIVNGLWGGWLATRDQIIGAYMLWSGAIIVQTVSWLALVKLMP